MKKQTKTLKKILLTCGILASVIYILIDIFAAFYTPGYSYINQTVSELSAIGAPARSIWIAMNFIFNPLLIAFGIGVFLSAQKKSLLTTGILLVIWGLLGFVWMFFPMHQRGSIGSTTDTMHLVMAGITVPFMMLFIGFGSSAKGKIFRFYSILTILAMLIFGALAGQQAPKVAAQSPTPGLGIIERISVYSPMIWMIILSLILSKSKKN